MAFEQGDTDPENVYLLDGRVTLLSDNTAVETIDAGSETARFPLAHQLPRTQTARAYNKVRIARIDSRQLSDFLARAEADDVLAELANQALERGDVFLMRVASGARGEDPGPDAWRQLAEAASRHGRERDAESALRLATVED